MSNVGAFTASPGASVGVGVGLAVASGVWVGTGSGDVGALGLAVDEMLGVELPPPDGSHGVHRPKHLILDIRMAIGKHHKPLRQGIFRQHLGTQAQLQCLPVECL